MIDFTNPTGNWDYQGKFSVELTPDANKERAPKISVVSFDGDVVTISVGRIKQTMGGIQLHALEKPFYWVYSHIKCIRKADGSLLWVNHDYRDEILGKK